MAKRYRFALGLVVTLLSCQFLLVASSTPANAAANCGAVARNVQNQLQAFSGQVDAGGKMLSVLTGELSKHPECKTHIDKLMMWNGGGAAKGQPFPFPASSDSLIYKLGPISWWWNLIYNKLFSGNVFFFLIFGWEIFLMGIIASIQIPLAILGAVFPVLGRIASAPFVLVARLRKLKD